VRIRATATTAAAFLDTLAQLFRLPAARVERWRRRSQPSGEINLLLATLVAELSVTDEWPREERDLWTCWFLRTLDKLYKVKE
jgi:hypothetical protein